MKKRAKKPSRSSANIMNQIKKEIDAMHKATADFVDVCIDIAKTHPKGINRIKKHVEGIVNNMSKVDKIFIGARK